MALPGPNIELDQLYSLHRPAISPMEDVSINKQGFPMGISDRTFKFVLFVFSIVVSKDSTYYEFSNCTKLYVWSILNAYDNPNYVIIGI